MLNVERIRLMTKLAAYEQEKGQDNEGINQYYREDYVSLHLIKTFVSTTIAFVLLVALYVLGHLEELTDTMYQMDYQQVAVRLGLGFVVFTAVFQVMAYVLYNRRYRRAHREQKRYLAQLRREDRLRESEETGGQL